MTGISEELAQEAQQRSLELQAIAEQNKPSKNGHKSKVQKEIDKTQIGIADRFGKDHQSDFKYVDGIGWFAWTGTHWEQNDSLGRVAIRSVLEKILSEASDLDIQAIALVHEDSLNGSNTHKSKIAELQKDAKEYRALAKKHHTANGIAEIQKAARDIQALRAKLEIFDTNKMLLNCSNCTVNLSTGEQMPHNRTDLITKIISTEYSPDATCPTWLRFLDDIMVNDSELVEYLQRIIGLCLTGLTQEHAFFILYGTGRNGKSTFMTTIQKLLGCYSKEIRADLLLRGGLSNAHAPTEELAKLFGARLATANESDLGRKLSESTIKQITGGDMVTARRMYQSGFEFKPEFKLFLRTNHKPEVDGTDQGIWGRIKLIPFEAVFSSGKADPRLFEKLEAELPGILLWAIQGLHKYLASDGTGGLTEPKRVKEATQQYRDEQNKFAEFLMIELITKSDFSFERGKTIQEIQADYRPYAELKGLPKLSDKAMAKALLDLGWTDRRTMNGRFKVPPSDWVKMCHG